MALIEQPFGLPPQTREQIREVFSKVPAVDEVLLYGSRAKGNYRPGSDIDLTLIGEQLDLKILNQLSLALDDLLTPYNFDLSIYHQIENPDLIDHIQRVGQVFYRRSG